MFFPFPHIQNKNFSTSNIQPQLKFNYKTIIYEFESETDDSSNANTKNNKGGVEITTWVPGVIGVGVVILIIIVVVIRRRQNVGFANLKLGAVRKNNKKETQEWINPWSTKHRQRQVAMDNPIYDFFASVA